MEIAMGVWLLCGILAAMVANAKHRSVIGWLLLGTLTGIFGLLAIAGMPALVADGPRVPHGSSSRDFVTLIAIVGGMMLLFTVLALVF